MPTLTPKQGDVIIGDMTGMDTTSPVSNTPSSYCPTSPQLLWVELCVSAELLFSTKLTWLLVLGPIALVGDATGRLSESTCFVLAGIALIPCAERLAFVTEQVATHTNGTIGGLLNATFGNAPEFLISTAALRSGFYRVVQLTLIGSVLTNLLFVFGLSCLVGGLRWQVQELRIPSGNVSVGMLLLATAGLLLPAALKMSQEMIIYSDTNANDTDDGSDAKDESVPVEDAELAFSRWNAAIMFILYIFYLTFQLGTHKDEFDDEEHGDESMEEHAEFRPKRKARKNKFCLALWNRILNRGAPRQYEGDVELAEMVTYDPLEAQRLTDREDETSLGSLDENVFQSSPKSRFDHDVHGQDRVSSQTPASLRRKLTPNGSNGKCNDSQSSLRSRQKQDESFQDDFHDDDSASARVEARRKSHFSDRVSAAAGSDCSIPTVEEPGSSL